jgi:hypothetical protein
MVCHVMVNNVVGTPFVWVQCNILGYNIKKIAIKVNILTLIPTAPSTIIYLLWEP